MNIASSAATSARTVTWTSDPGRPQDEEIIRLVGGHRALSCLPASDVRSLIRQAAFTRYDARELIFSQGDEGRSVMLVVQGYVKLSSNTAGGREVLLELAGPGRIFGELAVFNGWGRAADAYAVTPCRIMSMDARLVMQTLARIPEAMLGLVRILSRRLRDVTEQLTDAVDTPGPGRLAKSLMKMAALHSKQVAGGLQINLVLSQRELGAMTGLTRESINKHLSAWRDEGLIRLTDRSITLLDLQGLKRIAGAAALD